MTDQGHDHHQGLDHGHARDRGLRGFVHYLLLLPKMWRGAASDHVIDTIAPGRGTDLVDIGAGMGPATVAAARRGAQVTAVDPMPYMRRILSLRRLVQRNRQAITVVAGTAEQLPIADATADVVVGVNTMHHWQDLDAAAAEIHRVLRPGGRIMLVDEDFDDPDHGRNRADGGRRHRRHRHRMTPVGAEEMADALSKAGLVATDAVTTSAAPGVPIKQATARKADV
ncbi:MAG: class I SAM-dependent methyltransferase [Acidimicrobiia bacterium]|nr:class I SAM-dependent methyltransferase [Acidimicrobiia bacterium]